MKIEFGCGANSKRVGYKTCDIRNLPGVDFVCAAWEIDQYITKDSVSEIYSRHFFEHLTFAQGRKLLSVWYDILKPRGICIMVVPDMDFHVRQWVNKRDMDHATAGFWGWQRDGDTEDWDVHKSGYNYETLSQLIKESKFVNCSRVETKPAHLEVKFFKP